MYRLDLISQDARPQTGRQVPWRHNVEGAVCGAHAHADTNTPHTNIDTNTDTMRYREEQTQKRAERGRGAGVSRCISSEARDTVKGQNGEGGRASVAR
jgi:hypothetical protein